MIHNYLRPISSDTTRYFLLYVRQTELTGSLCVNRTTFRLIPFGEYLVPRVRVRMLFSGGTTTSMLTIQKRLRNNPKVPHLHFY